MPSCNFYQAEKKDVKEIFISLRKLKDTKVIFTLPNADSGSNEIYKMIKNFVKKYF